MEELRNLNDVLIEQLKDIYSAEQQILKALPKVAKQCSSAKLREAVQTHEQETKEQVQRLDKVADILGVKLTGKNCRAMQGIMEEVDETLSLKGERAALDAAIIAGAQRVEHYEIAAYGSVRAYAEELGLDDVVELLSETLDEEERTDEILTDIAEEDVNVDAAASNREEGESEESRSNR